MLFLIYYERIVEANVNHWLSFLIGLQMDTISTCIILIIPTILLFLSPKIFEMYIRKFLRMYFLVFLLLAVYIESVTLPFIAEFDVRPNSIFINYLQYPTEIFGNIWECYKAELFITLLIMVFSTYIFLNSTREIFQNAFEVPYFIRILMFFPIALVIFIGIRSSFGHRGANTSTAVYTNSHLVNEITKNSLHSIGYALYSQKQHGGSAKKYGSIPKEEAYARVSKQLRIPSGNVEHPFFREQKTRFKMSKPKNIVIFIQESLGAQFVGALGNKEGITPNIDALSNESIFFEEVYSNGTRSVRGIAGLVSGYLSVPGKGVLKRNKSQNGFFTIAQVLKDQGFNSSFIYGGESNFDNMRSWFLGNGFDEVIDLAKFKNPCFTGVWGICDEGLVQRADEEFVKMHKKGQPFVSVIFSTTNHTPFDFPDGRIELIEGEKKRSVKNAIKYADYAIGKLISDAKEHAYFEDTLFLIAADHNVRTYGDNLVPINMYHIPGFILGGGVKAQRVKKLTTQPDLLATVLDLAGVDVSYPILGKSLFEDSKKETVLMQFHDIYALRNKNEVAIIQPEKEALTFKYIDGHLQLTEHNIALERDALAFVHVLNDMYQNRLYY